MNKKKLHPQYTHQMNVDDWIDFLYATDESVFEPFFQASQDLSTQKILIPILTLNKQCILNCRFCHFQRDLSMISDESLPKFLFSDDRLASIADGINQLNLLSVLVESGVLSNVHSHYLTRQLNVLRRCLSNASLCLDIGSQNFLDHSSFFLDSESFFLDYVTTNVSRANELQVFDRQSDLIKKIYASDIKISCYANFIVDLPGLSFEDVVNDVFFLLSLPIVGIKISPFLARSGTVFEIFEKACLLTTLKIICMVRLLRPEWKIFIHPSIDKLGFADGMKRALNVGADYAIFSLNELLDCLSLDSPLTIESIKAMEKQIQHLNATWIL